MPPKKKRLSPTQKKMRAFLKSRISFHSKGFQDARKAGQQATKLRSQTTDPERKNLLSQAANDLTSLADWHLHRGQKMRKRKFKRFPSANSSKEKK